MTTDVQINDNDASILAVLVHRPSSIREVQTILKTLSLPSISMETAIAQSIEKLQTWGLLEPHDATRYRVPKGAMEGLKKIIGGL